MPEEETKAEGEQAEAGAPAAPEKKPAAKKIEEMTDEEKNAHIAALETDKTNLNKALHKERKDNKGNKTEEDAAAVAKVAEELSAVKARLEKAEKEKLAARYVQSPEDLEATLSYYEKLVGGSTDPKAQDEAMREAATLVVTRKRGAVDPVQQAGASMHGGSRSNVSPDAVSPQTVALGSRFGVSEADLKKDGKPNIYNS